MNTNCRPLLAVSDARGVGPGTMYERKLTEQEREYVLREAADELSVRLCSRVLTLAHGSANANTGESTTPFPPTYDAVIDGPNTDVYTLNRETPLAHLAETVRRYIPRQNLFSEWNEFFVGTAGSPLPAHNERTVLVASSGNRWAFEGTTAVHVVPTKAQEFADWLLRLTFSAERAGPCPHPSDSPQRIPWPMAEDLA
ncbi:hypothetical protein PENSPDRAFT_693205 [Peniophora sp. CONT]|nr:hypothetical protein PENSPDRAFT_693205 [Peniophora sp. CONT]